MASKNFGTALCQHCEIPFEKVKPWQKFHSSACRKRSLLKFTEKTLPEARRQAAIKGGQSKSQKKVEASRANWKKFRPGKGEGSPVHGQ